MSFNGYLTAIERKTGKTPDDFAAMARARGWLESDTLNSDVRAGDVVAWLKDDFGLGQGHAMAIYALLKGLRKPGD